MTELGDMIAFGIVIGLVCAAVSAILYCVCIALHVRPLSTLEDHAAINQNTSDCIV